MIMLLRGGGGGPTFPRCVVRSAKREIRPGGEVVQHRGCAVSADGPPDIGRRDRALREVSEGLVAGGR